MHIKSLKSHLFILIPVFLILFISCASKKYNVKTKPCDCPIMKKNSRIKNQGSIMFQDNKHTISKSFYS